MFRSRTSKDADLEQDAPRDVALSEDEWRSRLTPEQYRVLRKAGTEPAFTGKYFDCHTDGTYHCAACSAELFSSDAKFDSGTGWPSFTEPAVARAVELHRDRSLRHVEDRSGLPGVRFTPRARVRRRATADGPAVLHQLVLTRPPPVLRGVLSLMAEPEITLYGTQWCGDCKRAKQFLGEQRVHYRFVDVDADEAGLAYVEQVSDGKRVIPVIVFGDGSTLVEPSNAELAAKLGLEALASRRFYDLIIVGSGPAGLTAALYTAREGIDTLVIERAGVGGQVGITERLDNFPGFPEGVTGDEFAGRLRRQAERFGVEVLAAQEVTAISPDGSYRCVTTADGTTYGAYAVLLALGSTYRRLGHSGRGGLHRRRRAFLRHL